MRRSLAAILAIAVPVLAARAGRAAAEPVVAVVSSGDLVRAHLGERAEGATQATFTAVSIRDPDGAWSPASLLPAPKAGLPFVHRGLTWFLEERVDRLGVRYDAITPVTGEGPQLAVRLERGQDLAGSAVAALDDWTFVVAESEGGVLLVRVVTTPGSSMEMDVVREESWEPPWPERTPLLAVGLSGALLHVVGRDGSTIRVTSHDGDTAQDLPELALPADAADVAACVAADGPLIACARPGRLDAWSWDGGAWRAVEPLGLAGGASLQGLGAAPVENRGAIVVGILSTGKPTLVASLLGGEGWGPLERRVIADEPARDAAVRPPDEQPTLEEVERRAVRLSRLRWALVVAAFPVLVLLLRHLARLRR